MTVDRTVAVSVALSRICPVLWPVAENIQTSSLGPLIMKIGGGGGGGENVFAAKNVSRPQPDSIHVFQVPPLIV